jgi:hypothetical protein
VHHPGAGSFREYAVDGTFADMAERAGITGRIHRAPTSPRAARLQAEMFSSLDVDPVLDTDALVSLSPSVSELLWLVESSPGATSSWREHAAGQAADGVHDISWRTILATERRHRELTWLSNR